jgi:hypothetical protein
LVLQEKAPVSPLNPPDLRFAREFGHIPGSRMEHLTGLQQFLKILTQADNIPIMAMMLLVLFFTYIGLKQARRNDQLIEHGQRDKIIDEMRK